MKKKTILLFLGVSVMCIAAACGQQGGETESSQTEVSGAESSEAESSNETVAQSSTETEGSSIETAGGYTIALESLEHETESGNVPTVYFTSEISSDALMSVYEALGITPEGNVGVKIHTGEGDGSYNLDPELIRELVQTVDGTLVECNTAYGGSRSSTAAHMQMAEDHGYTEIADADIMDADGSMEIPVEGGTRLESNLVGAHFSDYDFFIVLSHFKGHAMGGFGGALKNVAIGMASSEGKSLVHTGGESHTGFGWNTSTTVFTESMAEPDMHDVGILASTDPVALDQACVDILYAVPDGESVIERMQSRDGEHILEHAEEISFGSREYKMESLDNAQ